MLTPYRTVLATPGARPFVLLGMVARLPMAMLGLGEVLLLRATTGSYAIAGAVSATGALANAVLGPAVGRQIDRRGQAGVLPLLIVVHALGSTALIVLAEAGAAHWSLYVAAALAGAGYPAFGFLVRARWSHLLADGGDRIQVAFALESVLDELCFVIGPPLVTLLATAVHPTAGLIATTTITTVAGTLFAAQRRSQPPPSGVVGRGHPGILRHRGLLTMFAIQLFIVTGFGCIDVTTVAFAGEHGSRAYAGPILACIALGSGLAGLASGVIRWRTPTEVRLWRGTCVLALAIAGLPFIDQVWLMCVVSFLVGISIAPTLTCLFALAEQLIPSEQLNEAFAVLNTAVGLGVAAGTAAGGAIVDGPGTAWSYTLSLAVTVVAAVIAVAGVRRFTPGSGTPTPGAALPAPAAQP